MTDKDAPIDDSYARLSRRDMMQWFTAAAATGSMGPGLTAMAQSPAIAPGTTGYGTDPELNKVHSPGEHWPLLLEGELLKTLTALVDTILPRDDLGPAASEVRVPDFVNEWVSAPYPRQANDRKVIVPGLEEFVAYVQAQHSKRFEALDPATQVALCEDIVDPKSGKPAARALNGFFHSLTMIAAGAYYSTEPGWAAIGYKGNLPSAFFYGPPKAVLEKVGVHQTVPDPE